MPLFLIMSLAAFTIFVLVLGFYSTRELFSAPRRSRAHSQIGTARRIQAIRESSSSGFSRT